MKTLLSKCPSCHGSLYISSLRCPDCGMELNNTFELSSFDELSSEQYSFLLSFLRCRGNLKGLQKELQISYPTAKKKLDDLLITLGLMEKSEESIQMREEVDMSNWATDGNSAKASEIIQHKLKESGGKAIVYTINGLPCEIRAAADGISFLSDKLPIKPPYRFDVFDQIVDLLLANNGRARKGNGRNYKLGEPECDETTVVGYIAKYYAKKEYGESVFDPVFVLAAVLDWAGIANNERGEIVLTASYKAKL